MDDILCLSPLEEVAHIVIKIRSLTLWNGKTVCIMSLCLTTLCSKEVHLISVPAAREVNAKSAMVTWILEVVRHEHKLITGKDLRIPTHCRHHRHYYLHTVRILTKNVTKTCCIVVSGEYHHVRKIMVHEIMRKDVVHTENTLAPARVILIDSRTYRVVEREVHDGLEVRVEAVLVLIVSLPVCKLRNRSCPALAHDIEVRILVHDSGTPLRHRILLIVWICVYSESVKISPFDPPDRPLLEIFQHVRIVEVHVHHRCVEPAALLDIEILLRSVRVHIGREYDIRTCVCIEDMIPVLERDISHPPVSRTCMVRNNVHDDLKALFVSLLYISAEKVVVTESRVDMVVVCTCITVVCGYRKVILEKRGTPDRCGTKSADIVKVIDYTLDVAAVTAERLVAGGLVRHSLDRVVRRVAVCETVRHDEVDHVSRGKACALCRAFLTCRNLIRILE